MRRVAEKAAHRAQRYSIAEAILIFGREMVILPDSYVFYTLNSLL